MKKGLLLQMAGGLAVAGVVAYGLATIPLAGVDSSPIPASAAGMTSPQNAVLASAGSPDAAMLEKAFAAQTMDLLGMHELDLSHRGADTLVNVQLSAEAIDSTVLRPDDVFSFNQIVGVRTIERGYQAGLMYSSGQLITGVGGGICITSTIIYSVALETGMRIIERHPHSGPVAYAQPGRDSAVAYGALDLQFENTTGSNVLIRSMIQDNKLVVAFYGKKQPGREVEISTEDFEPIPYEVEQKEDATIAEGESKVDQTGHPGFSVTTIRIIRQDGKVVSREMISRDMIRPRNEIVLVHSAATQPPANSLPNLVPMPYKYDYELPKAELTLPDPTTGSKSENALPLPDAGMQEKTQKSDDTAVTP